MCRFSSRENLHDSITQVLNRVLTIPRLQCKLPKGLETPRKDVNTCNQIEWIALREQATLCRKQARFLFLMISLFSFVCPLRSPSIRVT